MAFLDKFFGQIKLNDDYDDYDDDEFFDEKEDEKPGKRHFKYDDDLDDFDDEPSKKKDTRKGKTNSTLKSKKAADSKNSSPDKDDKKKAPKKSRFKDDFDDFDDLDDFDDEPKSLFGSRNKKSSKVTSINSKRSNSGMEVKVIHPTSMEDTRDIADTLLEKCTVVLNLEGLDVDMAQRIIDFTCGSCYTLNGALQKVSSYIFIVTPSDVEISGDIESILNGSFNNIPSMRSQY